MEILIEERGEEGSSSANPRKNGKVPAMTAPKETKEKTKSSFTTNTFEPIRVGSKVKVTYLPRLLEIKRPDDQSKSKDPNFCKYHRLVGHPTEKCFVLKDRIMELVAQGRIKIGAENTASSHAISIKAEPNRRTRLHQQKVTRKEYRPKSGPSNRSHHNNKRLPAKVTPKLAPRELAAADAEGGKQKEEKTSHVGGVLFEGVFHTANNGGDLLNSTSRAPTAKDKGKRLVIECDGLETLLKQISPLNKIEDDLDLDIRSKQALIRILDKPEEIKAELEMLLMRKHDLRKVGLTPPYRKEEEDALSSPQLARSEQTLAVTCPPCITFREEDTQLGTKNLNRPLFISDYIRDHKINHILIDCGSVVNILPICTMKNVGLSAGDLSPSSLLIQGFNQEGQRTLGMANIKLHIGDMVAETPFQVIDSRTSYNLPLGSTMASFKRSRAIHTAPMLQVLGKRRTKDAVTGHKTAGAKASCISKADHDAGRASQAAGAQQPIGTRSQIGRDRSKASTTRCTHLAIKPTVAKGEAPLVVSHKIQPTPLPKKVTLPLPKLEEQSIVKQLPNQQQLPSTPSNEGFDPNAYRLMARAGGNLTKDEIHANPPITLPVLTPEQEKLRNKGQRINQGRLGLGYQKQKPIKIYTSQTKPIKIARKASADVHQVSVGQTLTKKKDALKPVVIYTLKAAIARARAYDSVMVNHISITDDDQEEDEFVLKEAPTEFVEGGQSTVDELKKVDLGTTEDPRLTFLSASLTDEEETEYMALLHEYRDIFAWNYMEIPDLDPQVAVHKLARRFRPKLVPKIEKEVDKLIAANFIREVKYPSWIANIVPVKKKTGQIRDEELTAFRMPKGIFCYKVMPFGLKNADATYQRAMQNIFDDFLHKRVECYVDDLVVKTKQRTDHLLDLWAVFERLRQFQLKMNPLKCAFGVTSGKFLGFIVYHRGIEIDQSKIDAIQKMPEPRNVSELKSFQAQERSVGALLGQGDEDNKEHYLYYLSRTLVGAELNYTLIEKTCIALIFVIQKLRHYLLAYSINLISRADPLKYIMSRPLLSGQLAKWALLLSEFEINFVSQRAIKGQALANFLADHPVPAEWELIEELPDKEIFLIEVLPPCEMYFDGAARTSGAGAGVLFVSPKKVLLRYSFVLTHNCSNNEAEYQAILLGLGIAVEMKLPQLNIYDDSPLVIKQLTGEFDVKKTELKPFLRNAGELLAQIPEASLHYVPRSDNGPADALAGIGASLALFDQ
ncbi:hypothetical protein H6P81_006433 [Aristolochia fimbriata]|uniref:RNase H type-1 domain-containing protein n=1 Tax=Aristolochia fimbriata TaxID=158543 RepID=A0AAV7EYG5_ARIFI|nr:hypothetical protein H6P81_006433 [Aristolochia fimbriata]